MAYEGKPAEAAYSYQAKVTASNLNVRSGAGTGYSTVGSVSQGKIVTVVAQKTGWSQIAYGTLKGWVSSQYLTLSTWTGYVNATSLTLRQSASLTSASLAVLPRNTALTVQGSDSTWLKVYVPSKKLYGWVSSSYVSKSPVATTSSVVYPQVVLKQSTSMRKGPGTGYAILSNETVGTTYSKIGESNGWFQVKKSNGVTGWILGTLLRDPATVLKGKIIVLDAGHGGYDVGAVGRLYYEKNLTLKTVLQLTPILQKAGAKVVLTRSSDVYQTLAYRASISNTNLANAFISVHYNSLNSTSTGLMTFYYSSSKDQALATSLQKGIRSKTTALPDKGVKFGDYHVLRENKRPAALIELGFLSNPTEEKVISSSTFQTNAVNGIYTGLFNYFLTR
nr:N-acetylmuramoyl-L-alanine amidase [Neobacillus terrae]